MMLPTLLIALLALGLCALWWHARFSGSAQAKSPDQPQKLLSPVVAVDPLTENTAAKDAARLEAKRLRELEDKLRVRESVIARLMSSADQADNQQTQLATDLGDKEDQIRMHQVKLRHLAILEPTLEQSRQQVQTLSRQVKQLSQLESAIKDKDQRIATLKNRVSHLEALAAVNSQRFEALRPLAARQAEADQLIQEKDLLISQLEHTATRTVDDLQHALAIKEQEIEQLSESSRHIPALEATLHKKDAQLAELSNSVRALEQTVAAGAAQIIRLERQAEEAAALQIRLDEQSDHVAGLEAEIRDMEDQVAQLQTVNSELLNAAAQTHEQLSASNAQDESTALRDDLASQAAQLAELETQLQQKNEQLNKLQAQSAEVGQLKSALSASTNEINQFQVRMAALSAVQQTLQEREATIAQQHEELKRLSEIESIAEQKEQELAELREASARLQDTQAKAANLRKALNKAELVAIAAEQSALQAQRLREDLFNLGRGKSSANAANDESDVSFDALESPASVQAVQALIARIEDLDTLEADIAQRDKKMGELQKKLATLSRTNKTAAKPRAKRTKASITEPLYEAPEERDDLKKIRGIGPVLEKTLNQLGVTTYRQLASFENEDITKVTQALGIIPDRIERDDWIGGARKALSASEARP